jgi:hypothetical protein
MYTIYALIDPRDGKVRYVGLTDNVYARFLQHIRCDGTNARKDAWIQELKAANVMLQMTTLQSVEDLKAASAREIYWIHHFLSLGILLYNNVIPNPAKELPKRPLIEILDHTTINDGEFTELEFKVYHLLIQGNISQNQIIKEIWGTSGGDKYQKASVELRQIIAKLLSDKKEAGRA